ncbi:putative disease resistance protein RGA1 isoform X2 [Quercus suber]|uniref:putative disease resistance protein RGA1 isoform X2 n=1 Tax=Quercus suber TaxID=58331 RepID=UPI000CE1E283|nr:putative disease resistance protein RGA1 isoform X2 [Quercus suber]
MAEGALFNVAKGITEKVGSLIAQEIVLLWNLKDEIEKLNNTVLTISAVLLDAEEKQQHNNQVRVWLERLNDALYAVDDLLDDISTEALRQEVMTRNKKAKEVHIFFSKSNQLVYGLKMGHKVKAMRERLDAIKNDRGFHLDEHPVETQVRHYRGRETHSFVRTEDVIGRDKDKVKIKKILLDPNVEGNVSILPIVGLGGLGKTTLAQYVFNDKEIKKRFKQKLWVCVSDNFDVKMIVEKILQSAKKVKLEELDLELLVKILKEEIDRKKYLLVLDDVWNENPRKWLELKILLMGGAIGSRILVTTRSNKVAEITKTTQPYFLKNLDKEESWSLFKQMAFENGQEPEKSIFKVVGRKILKRCKGVPLAIRTIGSLLYFKNTEKEWLSFKDSELSKVPQEENDILPTLKLSYNHLPSHLKQCFAYCCLFPKDYKIHKPTLIQMWMAQGFIRPLNQNQCLEDVGHEYIMDLLWRSFFQEVEKDERGNILHFKMHDLMHDLAKLVAGSYSSTCNSKKEIIDEKTLHVSFGGQSQSQIPTSLLKASRTRTFMLQNEIRSPNKSSTIVASFKFIRLLDLHCTGIIKVPSSIGGLEHLRYLDLSGNNRITMLPNSITRLHNLQTLRLHKCQLITELPRDFTNLISLKFLEIDSLTHIPHGLDGLEQMTSLQVLSVFKISMNSGSRVKRNSGLKDLQGPNELKFPKVQEMRLYNYRGVKFPNWMSSLTTLVTFSLEDCNKCQYLPPLEQIPSLRYLYLNKLDSLEYMSEIDYNEELSNSSFIPSLFRLELSCCPNLKGWWRQRRDCLEEVDDDKNHLLPFFSGLSYLQIENCPKLTSMPLFPNVKRLTLDICSLKPLKQTSTLQIEIANSSFAPLSKLEYLETGTLKEPLPNLSNLVSLGCRGPPPQEWQGLKSLQSLEIMRCLKLKSLPEGMGGLTSLQKLEIIRCNKLKSLSEVMGSLASLQTLKIFKCHKLKSLPEGIQGLTSLNTLEISHCPILLERCKRETGKDWAKIAHIPNLEGGLRRQQTN